MPETWVIADYWNGDGTVDRNDSGEYSCTCKDFLFKTDNCIHIRKVKSDLEKEERRKKQKEREQKKKQVEVKAKKKVEDLKLPKHDDILVTKRSIQLPDD